MGEPCYRYHKDHLKGLIYDSEDLPSEADGWFDSPKKCVQWEVPLPTIDLAPLSGEFADPKAFAHVRAYVSACDPHVPPTLEGDARAASGKTDEELADMDKAAESFRRRALLYYARRKFNKELAKNGSPGSLFEACLVLDDGGDLP